MVFRRLVMIWAFSLRYQSSSELAGGPFFFSPSWDWLFLPISQARWILTLCPLEHVTDVTEEIHQKPQTSFFLH